MEAYFWGVSVEYNPSLACYAAILDDEMHSAQRAGVSQKQPLFKGEDDQLKDEGGGRGREKYFNFTFLPRPSATFLHYSTL